MLKITREDFREIYSGLSILEDEDLFFTDPASNQDLFDTYMPSKLWRLNNLYTIIDKLGNRVPFVMNRSQHKAYAAILRHPRLIILKSRQQGISTLWLISFFDDAITKKDLKIGLMAQGVAEAANLLDRVKLLWRELAPFVKTFLGINIDKDNSLEFSFTNNSKIYIRTSFRSDTLQRLHISEMGKIANKYPEKAEETKTGTLQTLAKGNIGIIESTAEGDNEFKYMWDNAYTYTGVRTHKDFAPLFLSWLDDPDCTEDIPQDIPSHADLYFMKLERDMGLKLTERQKNFWVVQYRELGDRIFQEYPATPAEAFKATRESAYYADSYLTNVLERGREVDNLFDKNLSVSCAYDIGHNDYMVCAVYQQYMGTWRLIDEIVDNGKDIRYYVDVMRTREWFDNLEVINLPFDGATVAVQTGLSCEDVFRDYLKDKQETVVRVMERSGKLAGIDCVRSVIPKLWVDRRCTYLIKCFYNYSKEWNPKTNTFRLTDKHDEFSHGADAIRYMCMSGYSEAKTLRDGKLIDRGYEQYMREFSSLV